MSKSVDVHMGRLSQCIEPNENLYSDAYQSLRSIVDQLIRSVLL